MAQFADAFSLHPDPAVATGEAIGSILERLSDPTAVVVMASGDLTWHLADAMEAVDALLSPEVLIGMSAGAVRGQGALLSARALTIWATDAPGIRAVRIDADPDDPGEFTVELSTGGGDFGTDQLLLWGDSASFDIDALLEWRPDADLVAGLLTPASTGGFPRLFVGQDEYDDGAVGLAIPLGVAEVHLDRGLRQIGDYFAVTEIIDGRPTALAGESVESHCDALGVTISQVELGAVLVGPGEAVEYLAPPSTSHGHSTQLQLGDLAAFWVYDATVFDEGLASTVTWYNGAAVIGFGPPSHGIASFALGPPDTAAASTLQIGSFGGVRTIFSDAFGGALFR